MGRGGKRPKHDHFFRRTPSLAPNQTLANDGRILVNEQPFGSAYLDSLESDLRGRAIGVPIDPWWLEPDPWDPRYWDYGQLVPASRYGSRGFRF